MESDPSTRISAGRSLAVAFAMLGDKKNAYITISATINQAKQDRLPEAYIAELQKLSEAFRQ